MLARIQVHRDRIELAVERNGLLQLLNDNMPSTAASLPSHPDMNHDPVCLTIPVRLRRTGIEMRLVVDDGSTPQEISEVLVRLLVRAHAFRDRLFTDTSLTVSDIAEQDGVTSSYVSRMLRLAFLAPSIATMILSGRQSPELTARKLMDNARPAPN